MSDLPRVSVILPAHNEEGNLGAVLDRCAEGLRETGHPYELVVVDDGSTDGTARIARDRAAADPRVRLVPHGVRQGITRALLSGTRAAAGDVLVFMCADMQSDPAEDLPKLLGPIDQGADVVLGYRENRTDGKEFVSGVYHRLSRLLFGTSFRDMNWIKAFRREVVAGMHLRSDWHRYIAILAHAAGYRIEEVPTRCLPRTWGVSKFKAGRVIPGFLDLLVVKFHASFLDRPMFFFGSVGLSLIGGAGLIAVYALACYVAERWVWPVPGGYKPLGGVYMAFLSCLLGGLLLFCFGFLAEFLATIRDEIRDLRGRPDRRP